ncbi:hypothetical protein [Kribbella jejuensis]|nr:hypothetical protein [Kribbella jejuensis]
MGPFDDDASDDESRERAEQVVDELLGRQQSDAVGSLSVADIENDVETFGQQLDLLGALGLGFPALAVGDEYIPMSLQLVSQPRRPIDLDDIQFLRLPGEWYYDRIRRDFELAELENDRFRTIPAEAAQETFRSRLVGFLTTRIAATAGRIGWPAQAIQLPLRRGGRRTAVPGCTFTVTANTSGLRVHWSGAYFASGKYFGHPTNPAVSTLQSGDYIFGVDGGSYTSIVWDHTVVKLPGTPSIHLLY